MSGNIDSQKLGERLEIIQNLPIRLDEKIWMSLVCMDLIPAWEIPIINDFDDSKITEINNRLIEAGFETELGDVSDAQCRPNKIREILYSSSKEFLNRLSAVKKDPYDTTPATKLEKGRLYGFPETAIQAYIKGPTISKHQLPPSIQQEDFMFLAQFGFSAENWEQEIETVKKWAEALKKEAPKLWEEYIAQQKAYKAENYGNR